MDDSERPVPFSKVSTEVINNFMLQEQLAAYQSMCRDVERIAWAEDPRPIYGPYNFDPRPIYGPLEPPPDLLLYDRWHYFIGVEFRDLKFCLHWDDSNYDSSMTLKEYQWRELRDFITEHVLKKNQIGRVGLVGIYPEFVAYHVGERAPSCLHSEGTQPAKMCNVCRRDMEVIAFHIASAIYEETGELISPTLARAIVKINKIEEVPVV